MREWCKADDALLNLLRSDANIGLSKCVNRGMQSIGLRVAVMRGTANLKIVFWKSSRLRLAFETVEFLESSKKRESARELFMERTIQSGLLILDYFRLQSARTTHCKSHTMHWLNFLLSLRMSPKCLMKARLDFVTVKLLWNCQTETVKTSGEPLSGCCRAFFELFGHSYSE